MAASDRCFESKARLRPELRRQCREDIAAERISIERHGASVLDQMLPLLCAPVQCRFSFAAFESFA